MQAEQILATACENESDNAKRMRLGLEPVSQPMPTLPAATVSKIRTKRVRMIHADDILFQFSRAYNILFQVEEDGVFFFSRFFSSFFFFDSINALINMVDAISTVAPWRLLELIQVFELKG